MLKGVRVTSAILLNRIVNKTPAPPTPVGQVYVRTGRLRAGWAGAAKKLGVAVPRQSVFPKNPAYYGASPRQTDLPVPTWREVVSPDIISFTSVNPVPYAFFVEVRGPGFGSGNGGVWMVARSIMETQETFQNEIQARWASL